MRPALAMTMSHRPLHSRQPLASMPACASGGACASALCREAVYCTHWLWFHWLGWEPSKVEVSRAWLWSPSTSLVKSEYRWQNTLAFSLSFSKVECVAAQMD